jgi:monothiol glutaredoxin
MVNKSHYPLINWFALTYKTVEDSPGWGYYWGGFDMGCSYQLQRDGIEGMENEVFDRIRQDIIENDIVLYMKGSAAFPQCGFSAAVVQVLESLDVKFMDIDVLSDSSLRQGLKDFANWPSTPQLYVKGEFIGGCDIVREMYAAGELQKLLAEKGLL